MTLGNKVFVSSTCYDLIDLRAELHIGLRDMGMSPFLSDSPNSDFETAISKNLIETCLVNLDSCDYVIFILSQRYGPTLEKYGYPKLSATHAEYHRALDKNKKILFYVRDRLLAEYSIWEKNPNSVDRGAWCKGLEDANHLFEFIKEHKSAPTQSAARSNWIGTFQSSVDLIEQIRKDLSAPSSEALLQSLAEKGALPGIRIKLTSTDGKPQIGQTGAYSITVAFTNYGTSTAYEVRVRLRQHNSKDSRYVGLGNPIAPNAVISQKFDIQMTDPHPGPYAVVDVQYRIDRGWLILELFALDRNLRYGYQGRKLVERATVVSQLPDDPWDKAGEQDNMKIILNSRRSGIG